jgi:hypothetical protein
VRTFSRWRQAGSHFLRVDLVEFGVVEQQTAPLRQAGDVAIAVLPADVVSRKICRAWSRCAELSSTPPTLSTSAPSTSVNLSAVMSRKALVSLMMCTSQAFERSQRIKIDSAGASPGIEPVSAETQLVSARSRSKFWILNNH